MPTKEDLLSELTVKQLRQLAKKDRVKLVEENLFWGTVPVSTKDDIIEVLSESSRITKKKIQALAKPPKTKAGKKEKPRQKRVRLTARQRIYIWENPKQYGRICSICHRRITKLSDLELDHTKPYSKGGTKLSLAHRDCNRMKSSGSLRKIQKALGIKPTRRKKKS